ncbi:protein DMP9-like [Macadamia integrifolia]|uniref:protein DMP9-like n=1 Tax=Macadamia integrifolia TaxID=60698 RepID=UPI001C4EED10|nr:protein DMP9-like [Macadamia integrifolia]
MDVQKTLLKISILLNFLPIGTLLAFEMLPPLVSAKGNFCEEDKVLSWVCDLQGVDGVQDDFFPLMSALVFVAIAFSDHRVTNCLFHGYAKELDEIMQTFPIIVGIVSSALFLIFPNTRYGIG